MDVEPWGSTVNRKHNDNTDKRYDGDLSNRRFSGYGTLRSVFGFSFLDVLLNVPKSKI